MMRGMMNGSMIILMASALLAVSLTVMVAAIAFVIAFPSIRYSETKIHDNQVARSLDPVQIVMRASKADERTVLDIIRQKGGHCLQKDITYKTGFSKLRTHRIVARLAEREIILVKKKGKTNEITLPTWLKDYGAEPDRDEITA